MKTKKTTILFTLVLMLAFLCPKTTFAAAEGTMMSNAVKVQFGREYYKNWGKATDHLNHYCKITVPTRGELTLTATKPYDDEGEYGKFTFSLYNEDGEIIWDYGCSKSQKDARDFYRFKVGLNAGTYYMTILPKFRVISGIIDTTYSFIFNENPYCEIEPNNGSAQATMLMEGKYYSGLYGYDYGNTARDDYYKMNLNAGTTYKISIGNFAKVESTTTIVDIIDPTGKSNSVKNNMSKLVDDDGRNYVLYTPSMTGSYYIHFDNYSGIQYAYTIGYSKYSKLNQDITGVASSYTKSCNTSYFDIPITAVGDISASSSNTNVASVYYSSYDNNLRVYIHKIGKATITLTAKETSMYHGAKKKFTVYVPSPSVKLVSVKNKKGKVLDVTWSCKYKNEIGGYQYQVSTSKTFKKNVKTYKSAAKWAGVYIRNSIKKNKTYYVRVRTYTVSGGKKYYSSWSKTKGVKVKR